MKPSDYLVRSQVVPHPQGLPKGASIYSKLKHLPSDRGFSLEENTLAIIGVNESRNSFNKDASKGPDAIRRYLYALSGSNIKFPLVDLGDIIDTQRPNDTYGALSEVVSQVVAKQGVCVVLGGTQELTWPVYRGIAENRSKVNVTLIDQTVDLGENDGDFSSTSFIDKFLQEPTERLFSLNVIGYQGYLSHSQNIATLKVRNSEVVRLGQVRAAMSETEPTLRDTDLVSLDMGCVRQGDNPGSFYPSPNGFYAEEVCQLARYSGLSPRAGAFGIFELNCGNDINGQSAHLAAQTIWHFIDAFNSRTRYLHVPGPSASLKKYFIKSPVPNINLVFLHNTSNNTWWFELTPPNDKGSEVMLVACSYNDYKLASSGDVPERWLRAWKKVI